MDESRRSCLDVQHGIKLKLVGDNVVIVSIGHGKTNMQLSVGNATDKWATTAPKYISGCNFKDTDSSIGSNSPTRGRPPIVGQVCCVIYKEVRRRIV